MKSFHRCLRLNLFNSQLFNLPKLLHRSLQYFTKSQSRSHFFRHTKGLPHATQTLLGKFDFFIPFMAFFSPSSSQFSTTENLPFF